MSYLIHEIQLMDHRDGRTIMTAGGMCLVTEAGSPDKVALLDPDDGTSITNPVPLTRGRARFAVASSVNSVDLYIMSPTGHFVVYEDAEAGTISEIMIDRGQKEQVAKIPFSIADASASSEEDTGIDLPVGAYVSPFLGINVTDVDATETIDFGILSSESGGDADGFGVAMSVATEGFVGAKSASTATRGALVGGSTLDRGHVVVENAQSVSYTLSAGSDTAKGYLILPYTLAAA